MKYLKRTLGMTAIAFLLASHTTHAKTPMKMGKIKSSNAVIVTNKTMMAKKVAGDFASYTLFINDKVMINNEPYYRVQTSEDINNAIGYVRVNDLEIHNIQNVKLNAKQVTLNSSEKVYNVPSGTERQVIDRAAKGSIVNADEAIVISGVKYIHGTINGTEGWVKLNGHQAVKQQPKAAVKPQPKAQPKKVTQVKPKSESKPERKETSQTEVVVPEVQQNFVQAPGYNHITVPYTLKDAFKMQMGLSPKPQSSNGIKWANAPRQSVINYMETEQLINDEVGKYQFLVLNESQGLTAEQLNVLLAGKGVLEGQGAAFKTASEKYNINEVYLISHAFLETAEGQSKLARGVKVKGEDKNKRYYNMFGIGAYDKNALKYGSQYAANVGWDTPAKAIIGGAEFIASGYVKENQNTLYTMRWNPQSPGVTQYATDIMWASSNASYIKSFYDKLGISGGKFNFIHYTK